MEEVHQVPPGATLVVLPYVSKTGFTGQTLRSLHLATMGGGMNRCKFLYMEDSSQVKARNLGCEAALAEGFEWLYFIDSDMDFPVKTLDRLKALDADIACTDMWARSWPSFRTVMVYGEPDESGMKQLYSHDIPVQTDSIAEPVVRDVDCCGMACTLIKTSLLKKFQADDHLWFEASVHGEDASFCIRAKQKYDATIRCDFGVMAGHWGVCRMAGQDFTRDARNQKMTITNLDMMKRMGVLNLHGA